MRWRVGVTRFFALALLAFWLGGFTFYSAVVIPELHEVLSAPEAGRITQRVTNVLNALGVAAVVAYWCAVAVDTQGPITGRRARGVLLLATTLLLGVLIVLHRVMDAHLASGGVRGFYPLHRAYLVVSTVQWAVNLGLIGLEASRDRAGR